MKVYHKRMRLNRFIGNYSTKGGQGFISGTEVEILDTKIIKQIKGVLRLKKDDIIILADGKGNNAEVTLVLVSANKVTGIINKVEKKDKTKRKKIQCCY